MASCLLPRPDFEALWSSLPTAGRFDATLASAPPPVAQVVAHLESEVCGFSVVAAGERDVTHGGGKQIFFCGAAPFKSHGLCRFLGEVVLHDSSRLLLCEYKCEHHEMSEAFVQQMQLGRLVQRVVRN